MEGGSILKLSIEKGPREGETLEFKSGSVIRIGRVVRGNTVAIKDLGVSSKHLSIEFKDTKWVVSDLDSSNGTLLNSAKLRPMTSLDLRHGDVIKIGECTSIKVHIEEEPMADRSHNLRRNPRRRGVASKDENLVSKVEKNCERFDTVVEKGGGRRVGSERTRALKEDNFVTEIRNGDENDEELENVRRVAENRPRRGRPRRAKGLCAVQEAGNLGFGLELKNAGPVEPKQGRGMSLRKARSSKNDEALVSGSVIQKIPESSGLGPVDCGGLEIEDKKMRAGARRKKKLQDAPSEVFHIDVSEDEKMVEGSNLRQETCKGSASTSGVKESCAEVGDGPDLEKMTLGEWFDYLEVYLPKQICDETEEMISTMRRKAEQFHEFMSQKQNEKEKGKLSMG